MKNIFEIKNKNKTFVKNDSWSSRNPLLLWRIYLSVSLVLFFGACVFSFYFYKKISKISFSEAPFSPVAEVESIKTEKMQNILSRFEKRKTDFESASIEQVFVEDPSI